MMKYSVIRRFTCKLDLKQYQNGDTYETADPDRAAFLIGKNAIVEQRKIVETKPVNGFRNYDFSDTFPKHTGGGWYELPNGDRIKGKVAAKKAMQTGGD